MATGEYMTSKEAGELLGLTADRVRQLAIDGKLPGQHHGRDWAFLRSDVEAYAASSRPKRGRPPKRKD